MQDRPRLGDAAYASVSFSSLAASIEARNLDNRGRDRDLRRQRSSKLLQGVLDQGPIKCTKCSENEEKLKDTKKKSLLEIEHLRQALKKCTDQLSGFMSANAFATFYQGLQLEVRFMSAVEDDEEEQNTRSRSESSPQSPKVSQAENKRLKDEILRLEDELARLELRNHQLEEDLKRANPSAGRRSSSAVTPPPKPAPKTEHNFAQTTEPWPKPGLSPSGQGLRLNSDDEGNDGLGKKGLKKSDGDNEALKKEIKELKKALERANDELDLAKMKLRKAERELKALEDAAKASDRPDASELEELRRKLKKMEELQKRLMEASGLSAEDLERIQEDLDETGEDDKGKKGRKGKDGRTDAGDEHNDDPSRKRKGDGPGKGKTGTGGKHGAGDFNLGGTGRKHGERGGPDGPGGETGYGGADEFGERRRVETVDASCGPGPGYPQDQEMPAVLKGSAPKQKPEEPLSKYKTVCSKQPRIQPSLSMMGEPSGYLGSTRSSAFAGSLKRASMPTWPASASLAATYQTNLGSTQSHTELLAEQPILAAEATINFAATEPSETTRVLETAVTAVESNLTSTQAASTMSGTAGELQQRLLGVETPSTKAATQQRTLAKTEASVFSSTAPFSNPAPSPQAAANSTWPAGGARQLIIPQPGQPTLVQSSSTPSFSTVSKPKKVGYTPQAEPYIMNIWEHHPHGGQSTEAMRLELINLGAVSPRTDAAKKGKGNGKGSLNSTADKRRARISSPTDTQQSTQAKERTIESAAA